MENIVQIKMAMPLLCKKVNNMLQAEYKWQNEPLSRVCGILIGVLSKFSLSEKMRVTTEMKY